MRSTLSVVFVVTAVLTLATPSRGEVAFYEGFDYPAGYIPAPWINDETSIQVADHGLTYSGLATSGNSIYGNANSFHNRASLADSDIGDLWNTTGSFYMTYLVDRFAPGSTTFYVWHELSLRPVGGGSYGGSPHFSMNVPWRDEAYKGNPGLATGFEFAGESETDSVDILPFGYGTTGVAVKFTMDTAPGAEDMAQIVLNPASFANEPIWAEADYTLTADVTASHEDKIVDTVNIHARNWNECFWDEIRIADTWVDVTTGGGGTVPGDGETTQHIWKGPSGDYNSVGNWSPTGTPLGNVKFGDTATGNTTVFTNEPISVIKMLFIGDTASYALAGHGPVNLNANTTTGEGALISVTSGAHQIQVPVSANIDATVDVADGSVLDIVGALSLNGYTLTKEGGGTLAINSLSSGGGTIVTNAGTVAGNGVVGDLVNLGGTISPGNAVSSASAVPEPTTGLMVGMGMLLLAMWGERRRK